MFRVNTRHLSSSFNSSSSSSSSSRLRLKVCANITPSSNISASVRSAAHIYTLNMNSWSNPLTCRCRGQQSIRHITTASTTATLAQKQTQTHWNSNYNSSSDASRHDDIRQQQQFVASSGSSLSAGVLAAPVAVPVSPSASPSPSPSPSPFGGDGSGSGSAPFTPMSDAHILQQQQLLQQQEQVFHLSASPELHESVITSTNMFVIKVWELFEFVHTASGLPWWASIITTVACFKLATLPLVIKQQQAGANMAIANPEIKILQEQYKSLKQLGELRSTDTAAMSLASKEIFARHNVSLATNLLLPFFFAPFYMCSFFALNHNFAPGFHTEGALWFKDLTLTDPTYVLPVLAGATTWATVELLPDSGMKSEHMAKLKWVFRVISLFTVGFCSTLPCAVMMYWITNASWSLVQNYLLRTTAGKKLFGIQDAQAIVAERKANGYYEQLTTPFSNRQTNRHVHGQEGAPSSSIYVPPPVKPTTVHKYVPRSGPRSSPSSSSSSSPYTNPGVSAQGLDNDSIRRDTKNMTIAQKWAYFKQQTEIEKQRYTDRIKQAQQQGQEQAQKQKQQDAQKKTDSKP